MRLSCTVLSLALGLCICPAFAAKPAPVKAKKAPAKNSGPAFTFESKGFTDDGFDDNINQPSLQLTVPAETEDELTDGIQNVIEMAMAKQGFVAIRQPQLEDIRRHPGILSIFVGAVRGCALFAPASNGVAQFTCDKVSIRGDRQQGRITNGRGVEFLLAFRPQDTVFKGGKATTRISVKPHILAAWTQGGGTMAYPNIVQFVESADLQKSVLQSIVDEINHAHPKPAQAGSEAAKKATPVEE